MLGGVLGNVLSDPQLQSQIGGVLGGMFGGSPGTAGQPGSGSSAAEAGLSHLFSMFHAGTPAPTDHLEKLDSLLDRPKGG